MDEIERHVAGATVKHTSPYAKLQVPVDDQPLSIDLRENWVKPLYFGLQRPEAKAFIAKHRHLVSDEVISQLLANFDWRPRTAAAYLAAVSNRTEFTTHIGHLLLRSDVCFAGSAYCLALTSFNSPQAIAFIEEYLDYYLTRHDLWFDQAQAMAALSYLDKVNGTAHLSRHLSSWDSFIAEKKNWNLPSRVIYFAEIMTTLNELKTGSG